MQKQEVELVEGALYRCVDGRLELIESDPDDTRVRLKLSEHASQALRRARARVAKAMRRRPELDAVASALVELYADHAPEQDYERWLHLRISRPQQATGRQTDPALHPRGDS